MIENKVCSVKLVYNNIKIYSTSKSMSFNLLLRYHFFGLTAIHRVILLKSQLLLQSSNNTTIQGCVFGSHFNSFLSQEILFRFCSDKYAQKYILLLEYLLGSFHYTFASDFFFIFDY